MIGFGARQFRQGLTVERRAGSAPGCADARMGAQRRLWGLTMPRNIEVKACITSVAALLPRIVAIASHGPTEERQDDTFFRCEAGRLKLRVFPDGKGELIFYRRVDTQGPKESFYLRSPTSAPETMRELLSLAYGQIGRVCKHRTLFVVGRTRVHIDCVEGLGHFLELEVVLADDETAAVGIREASSLLEQLGVVPSQLVEGAYIDLVYREGRRNR